MKAPSVKPVRCAIYTRVSTDHGLDQEFNSLDAQYDARNFWMQRRSAKNRHSNARTPAETKIRELSGRKSPQKPPISDRRRFLRFGKTGWWAHQGSNLGPDD